MNLKIILLTLATIIAYILLSCEKEEPQPETVTDHDGNIYSTVKIGNQIWMAENMKTKHYANGDAIPDGTGAGVISEETDPEYWFVYNNNLNNVSTYGRLYTWHTVTDSRNVCPDGWHVPSATEWTQLTDYLGGGSVAGGKLKEAGTTHWSSPNNGATNESGFTGLPGGGRACGTGLFGSLGENGHFWTATKDDSSSAWNQMLLHSDAGVYQYSTSKSHGFSVRCLKDN